MFLEFAIALLLNAPSAHASAVEVPLVKESLSQKIRSNATHYWSYVKKDTLKPFSDFEGVVAGDPHMGNFSVVPVETTGGERTLRFLDIDFDDAGVGPFALDFARFVVTVKVVDKDVKIRDLVQAYVDGLRGQRAQAPARIQETLSMSMERYDALDERYVDKKTSHGKFKIESGEVERYDAKYSPNDIARLFPNEKVLDLATRPSERGGSANAIRIWVLTETPGGVQHINEIKGYQPTALLKFKAQAQPLDLIKQVQAVFWPGLNPSSYDLKTLAGDLVWVRGKKVPLIDIPYKQKSGNDQVFVEGLALYDANLLGLVHGAQSRDYAATVSGAQESFREAVKLLSRDYIDYAEKTL
jgi:hypothetical protein